MTLRYAPLLVFALVVVIFLIGLTRDPREVPSPLIGKPVPAFSLSTLHAPKTSISQTDMLGDITLVNFWATWCVGCREEHPVLLSISRDSQVRLIGMNYKDDRQAAIVWLRRHGNPYEQSGFDQNGRVGLDLGVYGLPETFVIDKRGQIVHKHVGALTPQIVEQEIKPLLERLRRAG